MKFTVEKSSDWNYDGTVELETVPALLKWIEANGGAVVIDLKDDTRGWTIEIYDCYRE